MSDAHRYANRIAQLSANGNGKGNGKASIVHTLTLTDGDPTAHRRDATHYAGKLRKLTGKAPPPEQLTIGDLYSAIMDDCREMIEERIHRGIAEIVEAIHDSVREQLQEAYTATLAEMVRFCDQEIETRLAEHLDRHEPLTRDKLENRLHAVFAGFDERFEDLFGAIEQLADNSEAQDNVLLEHEGAVKSLTALLSPH